MSKTYTPIENIELNANSTFPHPAELPEIAHFDDQALDVMIDFNQIPPMTIIPTENIDAALTEMRVSGEHVLLVTDREQNDAVVGLISSVDIQGAKPLKLIQERKIKRADVKVRMVMTKQENVLTLSMDDLRHAKVGNVVQTMKNAKQHYALAVEIDEDSKVQTVVGLFSLSKISKQLNVDVASILPEAHSISELQHFHS